MSKKKIIGIVGLLLILVGLGAGVYLVRQRQEIREKAAPATSLSLKAPTGKTILVNDNFDVTVEVDTSTNTLSAAVLEINFDKQKLKLATLAPGTFLPVVLSSAQIGDGVANVSLGAQAANPPQGKGTLATLKFVALASGNAAISFGAKTKASGIYESADVLISKTPTTITIVGQAASPSPSIAPATNPSPSPSGSPRAGASPSPSPVGGTGGAASPSPSASPTASPSPSGASKPTVNFPANKTVAPGAVITGTAAPNSTVTITIQSETITATVKADSTGKWSYTIPSTLTPGTHTITVTDSNGTYTTTFTVSGSTGSSATVSGETPQAGFALPTMVAVVVGFLSIFAGSLFAFK